MWKLGDIGSRKVEPFLRVAVGAEWHGGPGYVTYVCEGVMVLGDSQTTPNV